MKGQTLGHGHGGLSMACEDNAVVQAWRQTASRAGHLGFGGAAVQSEKFLPGHSHYENNLPLEVGHY